MAIGCSGYKFFFSLILFTQLANCGPQGLRAERLPYSDPDDLSLSNGSGSMAENPPSDYSSHPSLSSDPSLSNDPSPNNDASLSNDPSLSNESGSVAVKELLDSPSDSSQADRPLLYSFATTIRDSFGTTIGGDQILQPYPTSTSNCKICTISVSVGPSPSSIPLWREILISSSQFPYTIGLRSPQIPLVSPHYLRHHRLQSHLD